MNKEQSKKPDKKSKKKTIVAFLGVFVLVLSTISIVLAYNQGVFAGDPKISEEEAKAIAEEYTNGTAISIELEKEGMSMVYEVVVENATGTWEVEIDANTGEILEVEEDDGDEEDDDDDDEDDDDDDDDDRRSEDEDDDDDENEHEYEGEEEGDN